MATKDYITPEYRLSHKGIICLEEFYRAMKNWISLNKYDFYEKEYKTLKNVEGDLIRMVWQAEKMIDDYHANEIEIEMEFSSMKPVAKKGSKKILHECMIKFVCRGYLLNDYEEQYAATPLKHFLRSIFDKFISREKLTAVESTLASDTKKVVDEAKSFFRVF